MDGWIIKFVPDGDAPEDYWAGQSKTAEIHGAFLYTSVGDARIEAGNLQTAYRDQSVSVLAAQKNIVVKP